MDSSLKYGRSDSAIGRSWSVSGVSLSAAEKLFARKGYAEVAMEDVAAARASQSALSTTTSRPNRRCCWQSSGVNQNRCLRAGRKILDHPPRDPVAAASAFTEIFLDDLTRDDRRLWRELFGAAIADPSVVGRRLFEGDAQLVSQLASLLQHYRDLWRSRIRSRTHSSGNGSVRRLFHLDDRLSDE